MNTKHKSTNQLIAHLDTNKRKGDRLFVEQDESIQDNDEVSYRIVVVWRVGRRFYDRHRGAEQYQCWGTGKTVRQALVHAVNRFKELSK